jgi:outer membrane protein assembly factor BamB
VSSLETSVDPSDDPAVSPPTTRPPLRLRVPFITVILFWVFVLSTYELELAMFLRFISRTGATLLMLLIVLGWWLRCRHFRFRERLLILGVLVLTIAAAVFVADPTMNLFPMVLTGLPFFLTGSGLWLAIAKRRPARVQLGGLAAVCLTVFGCLCLVRWEGLDGRQRAQYAWRWSPTAEEKFLADSKTHASSDASAASSKVLSVQPGDSASFLTGESEGVAGALAFSDWKTTPPPLLWRRRVGPAWSGMSLIDGVLLTQEQRGESESVVAYQAATGDEIWTSQAPGRFEEALSGAGPRGTPAFCDNQVYSLGARGFLSCVSASDGASVWSKNILADAEKDIPQWGLSVSPLIVDHLAVVFAGGTVGLAAYDLKTGEKVWSHASGSQSYSSPQLMTINGQRQIVMHDVRALFAVEPADGRLLWEHPNAGEAAVPMLQPHLVGDSDLVLGWGNGVIRLNLLREGDNWSATPVWESNRLKPGFNEFAIHQNHIYGLDDGILCCIDLQTGKRLWKAGRYGFGQLLLLRDMSRLLIVTETGDIVLATANPEKHEELGRFKAIDGKCWNHPLLAHGRLYVRNAEEMACFQLDAAGP